MSRHSIRAGSIAAAGLAAFYALVVGWASGLDHLAGQARADWYYLAAILAGFGIQVAFIVELRHRHRARHVDEAAAGAGATASTVGMVACCAHHLADVAPVIGASGAAAFLTDQRIPVMLIGIAVNAVGVTLAARGLWRDGHPTSPSAAPWHAA